MKKEGFKNKKIRKITLSQQLHLLECVEDNPILLTKKFTSAFSRFLFNQEWVKIAKQLNKMSNNARSSMKWQMVLASWTSNVKNKAAEIRRIRNSSGGGNLMKNLLILTPIEDRLLAVKGKTSVEGDGVTKEIGLESDQQDEMTVTLQEMHEERRKLQKEIGSTLNNILNVIVQTSDTLLNFNKL
ncbi:uncharacterized protein LOC122510990 [Leptopilina heterotoma]|uniref:uncharacterized protein LOC122510990 n=1 Tax=Leptopilina heterotoma TaxID=63436 RepID=UPI001CA7D2AE|nr:uncharacterized protein LOC122510990 [Leptopilina heterotoma]